MMNKKFGGMLGLAFRAGKLSCGEAKAAEAVRSGRCCLLILSSDASDNTVKKFTDKANYYSVDLIRPADREELGTAVGRDMLVIAAVTDMGFANQLRTLCDSLDSK